MEVGILTAACQSEAGVEVGILIAPNQLEAGVEVCLFCLFLSSIEILWLFDFSQICMVCCQYDKNHFCFQLVLITPHLFEMICFFVKYCGQVMVIYAN